MSGPLVYEMLFRGDATSAKAAAAEVQAAAGAVASQTQQATAATAAETAAVIANAEARQRAAQATTAHAQAEQTARSVMAASAGIPSAGAASAHAANLSFQLNDIAMMTMAGQNPMMLMMQQGTQVTQVFGQMRASGLSLGTALRGAFMGMLNPMSLATMAVIGFGTAAVQWLMDTGEEAQTLDEALGQLESSTKAVKSALKEARRGTDDLAEDFGSGARAARELNIALLGLARMEAALEAKKAIEAVSASIGDMQSWLNFGVADSRTLEKQFNLTARGAQEVSAAIQKFQFAETFEDQVEASQGIAEAMERTQYNTDGASEEALTFGAAVGKTALEAQRLTVAEIVTRALPMATEADLGRMRVALVTDRGTQIVPHELWALARPRPGVRVVIRVTPGKGVLRSILSIVVAVVAVALAPMVAGLLGVTSALGVGLITAGLTIVGQLLINALIPPVKPDTERKNAYSITGWKNRYEPGGAVPVVLGTMRFAPPMAGTPHTEIVGDEQYVRVAFLIGEGEVAIDDMRLGETSLSEYDEVETEVRTGIAGDLPLSLFDMVGVAVSSIKDTYADIVSLIGMILTFAGSAVAASAVVLKPEDAVSIGIARFCNRNPEEDLRLPAVQNLLRASSHAKWGLVAVAVGTFLQAVPVFVRLVFQV